MLGRVLRQRSVADDRGSAVVGFALVTLAILPLVLAVMQLAIVWHVRNTMTAAASEGARYGAGYQRGPDDAVARTRSAIGSSLDPDLVRQVTANPTSVAGQPGLEVDVTADVPLLGLWGPSITLHVEGHAIREVLP